MRRSDGVAGERLLVSFSIAIPATNRQASQRQKAPLKETGGRPPSFHFRCHKEMQLSRLVTVAIGLKWHTHGYIMRRIVNPAFSKISFHSKAPEMCMYMVYRDKD